MWRSLKPVATKTSWGTDQGPQQNKGAFLGAEKLRKRTSENERGKKHLHPHLACTREQKEESERTKGAIDLHFKRKSL